MLRGLATVSFYADDLAAAKRWYTEALGVEAYYAFPKEGPPAYIEFRIGDYEHEPITSRGEGTGFVTASVIDPFGNILGIMSNPHYVSVLSDKR